MGDVEKNDKDGELSFPSVDDVAPLEQGGPVARSGFGYQDEVAVGFLIEMLETPTLLKVHCETHDDMILVRQLADDSLPIAEFVQVKAGAADQLWSAAALCARKSGAVGTSIYETSLGRDRHKEVAWFRLVTFRDVASELHVLTFPRGAPGREVTNEKYQALCEDIGQRCPGFESSKCNGAEYWLTNCLWDVRHTEETIAQQNLIRLLRLSTNEGLGLLVEHATILLQDLRNMVKEAGDAKWEPDRDKKIIHREHLREWWLRRASEVVDGTSDTTGGKLRKKMAAAALPEDVIRLALDLRRSYSSANRSPRYMENDADGRMRDRVKSALMSLRAQYVAGRVSADSKDFHAQCVEAMDALNSSRPEGVDDQSAYVKGCMYDIVDRCLHRFDRTAS